MQVKFCRSEVITCQTRRAAFRLYILDSVPENENLIHDSALICPSSNTNYPNGAEFTGIPAKFVSERYFPGGTK